ncbi:MAG: glycosyltransferase family 39 protein [Methylacidiphilales bacterium]|nr:glycosyltransferase family 39 protein [Candidatus Methylacidiphilales bacterium]
MIKLFHKFRRTWPLLLVLAYYAIAAGAMARTKLPWIDEAFVANPAYNLLHGHGLVTDFYEPADHTNETFARYTYWMPPVWFLVLAAWFKMLGFGLMQQRCLSVIWGAVCLIATYMIGWKVSGRRAVGLLASALLASDFLFLNHAADGRMDMMVAACSFSAYAIYLLLRERNLAYAVLASQTLIVLAGLTNPIGIIGWLGMLYLVLILDWKRLRPGLLLPAIAPYLAGGVLWGIYISKNVPVFLEQFGEKTSAPDLNPLTALAGEIAVRYLPLYGVDISGHVKALSGLIIFLVYSGGVAGAWWIFLHRRRLAEGLLPGLWAIEFAGMAFLITLKSDYHMPQILPLYALLLAGFAVELWNWKGGRIAACGLVAALLICQLSIVAHKVRADYYSNLYLPVSRMVDAQDEGRIISAGPEFGFSNGFRSNLKDDFFYGYYTGKIPDLIVVRKGAAKAKPSDPKLDAYLKDLFANRLQLSYENSCYLVFAKKDGSGHP